MAWELFVSVVKQAKKLGVGSLGLHYGGESTLHPDFPRMLDHVADGTFTLNYSTNGMGPVSDEVIEATIRAGGGGLKQVNFSIHVAGRKPLETAKRYMAARRKAGQRKPVLTSKINWDGQTPEQLDELHAKWVGSGAVDSLGVTGTIRDMAWATIPKGTKSSAAKVCSQPLRYAAVLWDGRMLICCRDLGAELIHGNAGTIGIRRSIMSDRQVRFRKQIQAHGCPQVPFCQKCKLWQRTLRFPKYTPGMWSG